MNPDGELAGLMTRFPHTGTVEWIGTRPRRRAPLVSRTRVKALARQGLEGDHYLTRTNGKRQVSLIQAEHLQVVARLIGSEKVSPAQLRRNIVVSGINLFALRSRQFEIGGVLLEGTGVCEPCSRMEEVLGPGGYNAMRGHGGIVCRILTDGDIRLGDAVSAQIVSAQA